MAKGCKRQPSAMKCTTPILSVVGSGEKREREPYSAQIFAERNGFQHVETKRAETNRRLGEQLSVQNLRL